MPSIFDSISGALGGIGQSLLDRRASVKVREAELLDQALRPLLMRRQQQASDRLTGLLGSPGNQPLPQEFGGQLFQDMGQGSGFLADPGNLANQVGLAAGIESQPEFAGAGLRMLDGILANEAAAARTASADELALQTAAITAGRNQQADLLKEQQQRFNQGQALESDFVRSLTSAQTAMSGFTGLNAALDEGNALAIQVAFTQLARLNDPGARMVTEQDVTVLESGLDQVSRFNKAMANIKGGVVGGDTIPLIRSIGRELAEGELKRGRTIFDNLEVRRQQNPLGITPQQVQGALGVSDILSSDAALETFLNGGQAQGTGQPTPQPPPGQRPIDPRQPGETDEQFLARFNAAQRGT